MSSTPAQAPIRLLVGTHLLLIVQAVLVLRSAPALDGTLRAIVVLTVVIGLAAFIAAICGERDAPATDWWRRDHAR